MKQFKKIGIYFAALIFLASCTENNPTNFNMEKPQSIAVQDSLDNNFNPLKTYVDSLNSSFKLGAGVSMSGYSDLGIMYRLVNSNFHEVTASGLHGAVVQADGSLGMESMNTFLNAAEEAGLSVFGNALLSHENQNAVHLNGKIAPLTVETPPYPNLLDLSGLQDGTMDGWMANPSGNVSIASGEGLTDDVDAVELMAGASSSSAADLQLTTPDIPVSSESEYHVEFFIKSDAAGEGRVSFEGLEEGNTPQIDWTGSGQASATFETGIGWKKISFNISGFTGQTINLNLDLGYASDVTYYLDINNFYVYDTSAEPLTVNLVENGGFETEGSGWGGYDNGNGDAEFGRTEAGMGVDAAGNPDPDGHAFYASNTADPNFWSTQTTYPFPPDEMENGTTYNLEFWVKGTAEGTIQPEIQNPDDNFASNGFGSVSVTTEWQKWELSTQMSIATEGGSERFLFSLGDYTGTFYLDNVKIYDAAGSAGGVTVVEKTANEKELILEASMESWISEIVDAASYVDAWDVVSKPIADQNPMGGQNGFQLKSGASGTTSGEFYWQDYIGADYGVQAFQLAREHGDEDDLLFISDDGLEQNLDKCRALINYVEYIESKGATVDGISTQMHISVDTDKQNITQMFELLEATGKMVKVSELEVALGSGITAENATEADYEQQADMYQFVVEEYFNTVPEDQRYGITVWSPINNEIGLWTTDYNRNRAYGGVATGLEGEFGSSNN